MPVSDYPALDGTLAESASNTAPGVRAGDDGAATRRQVAFTAIARRAASLLPDIHVLMLDAATMIAEALEADYCGLSSPGENGKLATREIMHASTDAARREHSTHALGWIETNSLSSYAISVGRPVVVPRLVEETRFTDVSLRQLGIVSAAEFPLKHGNQPLASLGVYYTRRRDLSEEEMLFAESISHLLTVAAVNDRSQRATVRLEGKHKALTHVSENLDVLTMVLSPESKIGDVNAVCRSITGFESLELEGRPFYSALLLPEEMPAVRRALRRARGGEKHVRFDCYILTKHGQRRRISWSFTPVDEESVRRGTLFGAGSDITEKCDALKKLDEVESAYENTKQTLGELLIRLEEDGATTPMSAPDAPEPKLPAGVARNRRRQRRVSYPFEQQIAPIVDDHLPEKSAFCDVRCHDIAGGGFSYLAPTPPKHTELVVALGSGCETIYLTAEVRNVRPHRLDGRPLHLVGCCYTGRAHY